MRSEEEIADEAQALWNAVFGEPPPVRAPGRMLLEYLVEHVPAPQYTTLRRFGVEPPFEAAPSPLPPGFAGP